jgi:hypothetical protein
MATLKFKKLTRAAFDALSPDYDPNTRYTVVEIDDSIKEYLGTKAYVPSSSGNSNGVTLYNDTEYADPNIKDTGNIKVTGYVSGKIDADQW